MKALLDTNICIALMRGHPKATARLAETTADECIVSTITAYELFTGVAKCREPEKERLKVRRLLSVMSIAAFDEGAARRAAEVRVNWRRPG